MQTFEKNYKNYKLLGTDSVTLLVLLHYIVLVLLYLYSVYLHITL